MLIPHRKATPEQKDPLPLLQKLKFACLPLALITVGILNSSAGNPVLMIIGVVSGLIAFAQPYLDNKRGNSQLKQAFLLMLGMLVVSFGNLLAEPAQAQVSKKTQTFFNTSLTSLGHAMPIVFNTLKALYIFLLAIILILILIGVFKSVKQDENWATVARIPILIVTSVTLVSLLYVTLNR